MHIRKHAAALAVTFLAIAALFATATPAQAEPTGCSDGTRDRTPTGGIYWYRCTGGDGSYAIVYRLRHPNPHADTWYYGLRTECVPTGQTIEFAYTLGNREPTSVAFC
ncbi:hypothetical protein [Sinosporangium siamense]|uniref:Secreted protein n=1 Tax=Sinosporangium siamense TaxID=1367973 RepID=A0A919RHE1_9ACTN|nr:hypothetical protein [Sinosporangium siamense]GII93921.1 hypothetical protein Ssi02_41520 [Sinosporangium siamense]